MGVRPVEYSPLVMSFDQQEESGKSKAILFAGGKMRWCLILFVVIFCLFVVVVIGFLRFCYFI